MQNSNTRKIGRSNFKNLRQQGGWTFWSFLFVILVILFFSYIGMQLVPIYAVNANVRNAMSRSLDGAELNKLGRGDIIRKMNAQLYLDGNDMLLDYKNELKVRRSRKQIFVETHYRREIPLFLNLSLVATFDNVEERNLNGTP